MGHTGRDPATLAPFLRFEGIMIHIIVFLISVAGGVIAWTESGSVEIGIAFFLAVTSIDAIFFMN